MRRKSILLAWLFVATLIAYAAITTIQLRQLQGRIAALEKTQPLVQRLQASVRAIEEGKLPPRWHQLSQNTAQ